MSTLTSAALLLLALALSPHAAARQAGAEAAREELYEGARLYRGGDYVAAERRFRRAFELDPSGRYTRLFIARAVHQQFKPGDPSPENVARGERAIAAYEEALPHHRPKEDIYRPLIFLNGALKRDGRVEAWLTRLGEDESVAAEQRADAFVVLASRRWKCSYDITEREENKAASEGGGVKYRRPASAADYRKARRCVAEGLRLIERALLLHPMAPNTWAYKAHLLREGSKLAEMGRLARERRRYDRLYAEAYKILQWLKEKK